jgi:hypothetical protein
MTGLWTPVLLASGGSRPEAGARLPEAVSPKQPFMHIADSLTTADISSN